MIAREQALSAMNIAAQNAIGPAPETHNPSPANLGDFVNQTLRMWEEAAAKVAGEPEGEELKGNLQIASSVLRHTYSVKEMAAPAEECICDTAQGPYCRAHKAEPEPPRGGPSAKEWLESRGLADVGLGWPSSKPIIGKPLTLIGVMEDFAAQRPSSPSPALGVLPWISRVRKLLSDMVEFSTGVDDRGYMKDPDIPSDYVAEAKELLASLEGKRHAFRPDRAVHVPAPVKRG